MFIKFVKCRGGMLICLYVDAFSRLGVYYMVMSYEIGEMRFKNHENNDNLDNPTPDGTV